MTHLLEVQDFCVSYINADGLKLAVDHVSFNIAPGEIVGFVGESGCGKTTLLQAIMRILPPPGFISGGSVLYKGEDMLSYSGDQIRALRWRQASMVFQSAMNSLNPVMRIDEQFFDTLQAHGITDKQERAERVAYLLQMVGIPTNRFKSFPHELSGGMRQRVGIALALLFEPELVIMDEPTTALDVIVQSEVLREIKTLQQKLGFSVCFVSHDLPVVAQICDRVNVFYEGCLVEQATTQKILAQPEHFHTQALLRSADPTHYGSFG